jgi:DoxX-like family
VAASNKTRWIGVALTVLPSLMFLFSAFLKLKGGPELDQGMAHLGLPPSMVVPLAILELTCVAVYLIPATSVLGAVLLTGYLGGAICTHWRVGDPFWTQILIGLVLWLGLYLREPRLKALLPLRTPAQGAGGDVR